MVSRPDPLQPWPWLHHPQQPWPPSWVMHPQSGERGPQEGQLPASVADQRFTALEADGWGSNSLLLTKVKVLLVLTPVGPQS